MYPADIHTHIHRDIICNRGRKKEKKKGKKKDGRKSREEEREKGG